MPYTITDVIGVLKNYSISSLSSKAAKEIAKKAGLEDKEVISMLSHEGIIGSQSASADGDNFYLLPDDAALTDINNALASIRQWADDKLVKVGSFAPERILSKIQNIYEFVAFFSIQKENNDGTIDESRLKKEADNWRQGLDNHSTDDLINFLEKLAIEHARNVAPIVFYKAVENACLTNIFVKGQIEAKAKYDFYLQLQETNILSDFDFFRDALPSKLIQSNFFVNSVIERMLRIKVPGVDVSKQQCIDIYNKRVFGLTRQDYYEEYENTITVFCPNCRKPYRGKTQKELESKKCNCKQPAVDLYRKCPRCNISMPAYLDYCPDKECHFFIPGTALFPVYCKQFTDAINRYNLAEAREAFKSAEKASPKPSELEKMRSQLNTLDQQIGRHVKKLDDLISGGRYHAAQQELPQIRAKIPNIDLSSYEKKIKEVLDWALQEGSKLSKDSDLAAVQRCITILNRVKDDPIAASWLETHKPQPVKDVSAIVHGKEKNCTITWKDNDNINVTYTIVRAQDHNPQGIKDGKIIAEKLLVLNVTDTDIQPGIAYYYTVFSVRGASATPSFCLTPVIMYEELSEKDVIIHVENEECQISWKLPDRCVGVRIIRRDESNDTSDRPIDVRSNSFTDYDVTTGERYIYTLKTIWEIGNTRTFSDGIKVKAIISARPEPIELHYKLEDENVKLTWAAPKYDHDIMFIALKQGKTLETNKRYSPSEYKQLGEVISTNRAKEGFFQLRIQQGSYIRIAAFSMYNGDAISGNSVTVSTLKPIDVDQKQTTYTSGNLHIEFNAIPKDVIRIGVAIMEPGKPYQQGTIRYIEKADAIFEESNDHMVYMYDIRAYKKNGYLSLANLHINGLFDAYIFAVYQTEFGEAESEGTRINNLNQKKTALNCKIKWGLLGRRKGACLYVSSDTGLLPKATLVCSSSGDLVLGWKPGLYRIAEIMPNMSCNQPIPLLDEQLKLPPGRARLNILLENEEDRNMFTVDFDADNFTIPNK